LVNGFSLLNLFFDGFCLNCIMILALLSSCMFNIFVIFCSLMFNLRKLTANVVVFNFLLKLFSFKLKLGDECIPETSVS